MTYHESLSAPFPYSGGKRRWSKIVKTYFGNDRRGVYSEPFAGSLALLLANDRPYAREVVADQNGYLVNVWNALIHDPEATAYWADAPTYHHRLTATHRFCLDNAPELAEALRNDPEFYDARLAGYWIYGQSNWIGAGFCSGYDWANDDHTESLRGEEAIPRVDHPQGSAVGVSRNLPTDKRPHLTAGMGIQVQRSNVPTDQQPETINHLGGNGVSVNRKTMPTDGMPSAQGGAIGGGGVQATRRTLGQKPTDGMPYTGCKDAPSSRGVNVGRQNLPTDGMPTMPGGNGPTGGRGVQITKRKVENSAPSYPGRGVRLLPWFLQLQARLERVIVLDRTWKSALTPSVLMDTPSSPDIPKFIIMDPPYLLGQGNRSTIYASDSGDDPDQAAIESYQWAIEHGERYSILYFCRDGDFELPPGWKLETMTFSGVRDTTRRAKHRDAALVSPRAQRNSAILEA